MGIVEGAVIVTEPEPAVAPPLIDTCTEPGLSVSLSVPLPSFSTAKISGLIGVGLKGVGGCGRAAASAMRSPEITRASRDKVAFQGLYNGRSQQERSRCEKSYAVARAKHQGCERLITRPNDTTSTRSSGRPRSSQAPQNRNEADYNLIGEWQPAQAGNEARMRSHAQTSPARR